MSGSFKILPILAGVLTGSLLSVSLAHAQDNSGNQLTVDGLSLGAPAPQQQDTGREVGEMYIQGEFNDWSMRCITAADGEDPCQMYQLLTDDQGSPIVEFTMFRLPPGAEAVAGATVIVPLETALQRGMVVQVDDLQAQTYPFSFCNQVGCYARIGLTQEDVDSYKAGGAAQITIIPITAPDQRVAVELSLSGFTAAFDAASVTQP